MSFSAATHRVLGSEAANVGGGPQTYRCPERQWEEGQRGGELLGEEEEQQGTGGRREEVMGLERKEEVRPAEGEGVCRAASIHPAGQGLLT